MELKDRIKNNQLPEDILNALSLMSFPLLPEDYAEVLPYVFQHGTKAIKENVQQSLRNFSKEILLDFFSKADDREVLLFYAQFFLKVEPDPELVISLLRNTNCPSEAFFMAAASPIPEILSFLVNNVALLQKHPSLVEILLKNPKLDAYLKEKLKEYEEFGILGGKKREREVVKPKDEKKQEVQVEQADVSEETIEEKADVEPEVGADTLKIPEEELEEEELTLYQKLLRMTVAQKIERALKGSKEERSLLIRDSNKVVAMAVIQSPKITEQEVEAIAGMRNVHKDVLRYIGRNRQFLKKYKIVLALVKNPKTPPDIALTLLNRIMEKDLKNLVRDRGISEFVRQAASRLLKSRKK